MDEKQSENINKTPEKMSRIAWPKEALAPILDHNLACLLEIS